MTKKHHVALSYASEQREYVAKVAACLKSHNVRCFYDKDEEVNLWGKNLLEVFQEVFAGEQSHFVVLFISQEYVSKVFTKKELEYTLSKEINQNQEYILPARFDSAKVPGLSTILKYIDISNKTPNQFSEMIIEKITDAGIHLGNNTAAGVVEIHKAPKPNDSEITLITQDESGNLISGSDIRLIQSIGIHRSGKTNEKGTVSFPLIGNRGVLHTIFVAHKDFIAGIVDNFDCDTNLKITLQKKKSTGSMIFDNRTGYIPGIQGRLNPILDTSKRTYLYATNISINNNTSQPAIFKLGENINIEDCFGKTADIQILRIIQKCIILNYITYEEG